MQRDPGSQRRRCRESSETEGAPCSEQRMCRHLVLPWFRPPIAQGPVLDTLNMMTPYIALPAQSAVVNAILGACGYE